MRIVILALGSRGDVQPYIALGLGLRAAGHDVRLATYANFEASVRSRGLGFFPVLGDIHALRSSESGRVRQEEIGNNPLLLSRLLLERYGPQLHRLLADSLEACQGAEVIVASAVGRLAGPHVAAKLRVPFLSALLHPWHPTRYMPSSSFPAAPYWLPFNGYYNLSTYYFFGQLIVWPLRRALNRARQEVLDLPPLPLRNPFGGSLKQRQHHPCLYGFSESVVPKPPDWGEQVHITGYWFLDSPPDWRPPQDLLDFLDSGPPPVSVGFGSTINHNPEEVTELVLKALARSRQRGVLLTGWGGLSNADLPDEVFKAEEVPHDWLFARMAAVVHHGGAGTTAAGLRAGVPSIIVPFLGGQRFWGRRVQKLGVGPKPIPFGRLSVKRLSDAVGAATNSEGMQTRAASLGKRIRAERGVKRAVEAFNSFTEGI